MLKYASVAVLEEAIYEVSLSFLHFFVALSHSLFACKSGLDKFGFMSGRFTNTSGLHWGSFAIRSCSCCCIPVLFCQHTIYANWSLYSIQNHADDLHALSLLVMKKIRLASACKLGIESGLFRCGWAWLSDRLWCLASEGMLKGWRWSAASFADF